MNKTVQFITLILLILIISVVMMYYYRIETNNREYEEKIQEAKKWFLALVNDDSENAIAAAAKLSKLNANKNKRGIPSSLYSKFFKENGLSPDFLNEGFNQFDYQLWSDAFFFKRVANQALQTLSLLERSNDDSRITTLFNLVDSELSNEDLPKGTIIWPFAVWYFKKGLCDRQSWVLCELAYQAGYETQLIYLWDPISRISPHTICEIRKDNKTWLADPFSSVLLCDTSLEDLDLNDDLKEKIWPDKKQWQETVHNAIYWTPAYPQDYCLRNQQLHKILLPILKQNTPRFGEDPDLRRERFIALGDDKFKSQHQYKLWFTPIRLLAIQKRIQLETEKFKNNK